MSRNRFHPARLDRMRDIMRRHVRPGEDGGVPGMVTLVSRHGETHVDAFGTMTDGGDEPMRRDTIFRIASLSKPVAAAAAMILVEECRLRLDDPVDPWLPELANRRVLKGIDGPVDDTVPAARPLTLRDLLTLRMGLGYLMTMEAQRYPIVAALREQQILQGPPRPQSVPAPDVWIARVAALPLMCQPGERWMYDLALDVLGVLIARASGKPYEVFLRERLFEPLGMRDTAFFVPAEKISRLPVSYWTDYATGKFGVFDAAEGGDWSRPPAFAAAAGGLVSTIDDYFAFAAMLSAGGRHGDTQILSRAAVDAMTTDQLTDAQKSVSGLVPDYFASHGWGFGMATVNRRTGVGQAAGSFGWDGGLGTSWYADPATGLTGILMTQRAWTSPVPPPVCADFWTAAYQACDD